MSRRHSCCCWRRSRPCCYRYSGQRDIRIGVPNANRPRLETQGLIGFFINTLVLRAKLDWRLPFTQLLAADPPDGTGCPGPSGPARSSNCWKPFRRPASRACSRSCSTTSNATSAPCAACRACSPKSCRGTAAKPSSTCNCTAKKTATGRLSLAFDYADGAVRRRRPSQRLAEHFINLLQAICAQPQQRPRRPAIADKRRPISKPTGAKRRRARPAVVARAARDQADFAQHRAGLGGRQPGPSPNCTPRPTAWPITCATKAWARTCAWRSPPSVRRNC